MFAAGSTGFSLCTFVLGFIAPIALGYVPIPEHVGTLAAIAAGVSLFWPRYQVLASLAGGMVAGSLAPMIAALLAPEATGTPVAPAIALAAAIPAITMWLARNPKFAPPVVMEEALLLLLLLGLGAALIPPVFEGWMMARGMNASVGDASLSLPAWVLLAGGASLICGSAWSVWRHR